MRLARGIKTLDNLDFYLFRVYLYNQCFGYNGDMTTITLDIPASKQPQVYHEFLTTLVDSYNLEEIEDFMLALHTMKNNEKDTMTVADFKAKYAHRSA
jgi:uncharacterized protein YvpB